MPVVNEPGRRSAPVDALADGGSRRNVLAAAVALAALPLGGAFQAARAQTERGAVPSLEPLPEFKRLVAANRILARENVVDAFGHVSVRHPKNPKRFVMSRSRSPALVEHEDLMEFELDGTPVDPRGRTVYGERMIHAAVYEARADVNSVVHNHSQAVLPFAITGGPLRPVIHTASIIGAEIPVWDIRDHFGDTDMLVRTLKEGRDLAAALGKHTCLLMRGHGCVVTGATIPRAVLTAIYLQVDATVQLQASGLGAVHGLSAGEIEKSSATQFSPLALDRAWEYFCQRAGVDPG
jgi:ribulose-5-phosphate 4-epimerase/fuculose-1-phosphate aldolase